jgi:hypothetical protein
MAGNEAKEEITSGLSLTSDSPGDGHTRNLFAITIPRTLLNALLKEISWLE